MTLDLDAIKARLEGVTALISDLSIRALSGEHSDEERAALLSEDDLLFQRDSDIIHARAVRAAARTDVPALVAEVEKLRAVFRVNMLRYGPPGTDHAKIDALLKGTDNDKA